MGKTLSAAAQQVFFADENVDPVAIVEVSWPASGVRYYSSRELSITGVTIENRVHSIQSINSTIGADSKGAVASVSVTLIDEDYALRGVLETDVIQAATVRVLLYEEDLAASDFVEMLSGKATAPRWTESGLLTFEVVSAVVSEKVGTTPTEDDIGDDFPEESQEQAWPVAFGSVEDIPAVLATRKPRTELSNDLNSNDTSFEVEDADDFPHGSTIKLNVDGEIIRGFFAAGSDIFTVQDRNVAKYAGIQTAGRGSGEDASNPFVLWLQDSTLDVVGYFFEFTNTVPGPGSGVAKRRVNMCVAQKGAKCWFENPWTRNNQDVWLVGNGAVANVYRFATQWVSGSQGFDGAGGWVTKAGALVTEFENEQEVWVASEIPATAVLRVRAFRRFQKNYAGLEDRRLVSVPSSLYTVNLSNASLASGKTPCTVKFQKPLSALNQGWDDSQVFVSVTSTEGSNVSDIIKYILETYTNLTVDTDSFEDANTALTKYPAHCAIQNGPDAIQVCHDLAFQARCALVTIGSTAYLRYLSAVPTQVTAGTSVNPDNTREESLAIEESSTDDVYTVVKGEWRKRLSEPWNRPRPREFTEERNVATFGKKEFRYDFWAFRNRSSVRKSVQFWANRMGNLWRMIRVQGYLGLMSAEPWDRIQCDVGSAFTPSPVTAWVHETQFQFRPYGVALLVWTPVLVGTTAVAAVAYQDDSDDTAPPDPANKIKEGSGEIAKVTPFSFALASEPLQQNVFFEITVVHTPGTLGGHGEATIALYPRGYSFASSGTAFLRSLNATTTGLQVGGRGTAFRAPGGWYVTTWG